VSELVDARLEGFFGLSVFVYLLLTVLDQDLKLFPLFLMLLAGILDLLSQHLILVLGVLHLKVQL
jgi:hypothetical protein